MSTFQEIKTQVAYEIQEKTCEIIEKFAELWTDTFELDVCEENLKKLSEHVTLFYNDVECEIRQRQNTIKNDIKKLKEEADKLRRLLKVDINLTPQKGIPLHTIAVKMDENLQDLREQLKIREDQIKELLLEQEVLCEELHEIPKLLLYDPLPSEDDLEDFRLYLAQMKGEKVNRQYEVSTLRRDIKDFLTELELSVESDEVSLLNDPDITLSQANLNRLRELREEYCKRMEEIRESIITMKEKLIILWECLEVNQSIRDKYLKYNDYSQTTYDKFYRELDRCEQLKRQDIKKFVDKIREDILEWWTKTLKSDIERSRFSNFTNDCYTEDLLTLHEMELEDLKKFYNNNEKIFDLINERKVLWDRMNALENKASDPNRYNNRGGQLLKEEKERKTIASKLPKIEAQLIELVHEYEKENNRKFTVYGEHILDLIEHDWDKKKEEKEKLMSARKNGQMKTPLSKTLLRTPLSNRNQTVSTIKKMPSNTNISSIPSSIKRKQPPSELLPHAKRTLFDDMMATTSNLLLRSTKTINKTPFKSPRKVTRVISTTIKRKSGRSSNGNTKSRQKIRTPQAIPQIVINENVLTSDSTSYDMFEEHCNKEPASRSSILNNKKQRRRSRRNRRTSKLQNPRQLRTPTKFNMFDNHGSMIHKSPGGLSRTGSPSAAAGPSNSRKLTTKNLPILI